MSAEVVRSDLTRGPSLCYVSKWTGWVGSERWQFLLTFSSIYADVGWVRKGPKMCWRNIGMVPRRLANWAMWPLWILSLSMMLLLQSQKMTGLVRSVQMQAICVHKFHETNWLRRVSPYFSRKLHYHAGSWKWPFRNSFFFIIPEIEWNI